MRLTISLVLVLALPLVGCGGDDKKVTTTTCAGDADCDGGLCFESVCYTACTESVDACAVGEICVLRARDEGEFSVCVAAAQIQCATHDDCAEVHSRECLHAKCDPDSSFCTFAEMPDASECFDYVPNATTEALDPTPPGACFHGECRALCTLDNDCPDVCALYFGFRGSVPAAGDKLYCAQAAELSCRADGFGAESSDACSTIVNHADGVCAFNTSAVGPGTVSANACEGGGAACISEGCALLCKTDADCADDGRCLGFYSFASLPDDTAIGFFKACRR